MLLAAAATGLGSFAAAETPLPTQSGWFEPAWVSALIGLALGVPVALRRLWPITMTAVVLAITAPVVISGAIPSYAGAAPIVSLGLVLYTVGVEISRRPSILVVLVSVTAFAVTFAFTPSEPFEIIFVAWVVAACWATGRTVRERRAFATSRAEQATALAVEQERLRLARELHDIVGHSMSMIAIKAAIADHVGDDHPEEMRAALRIIGTTSRQTLGEIRRALALVRTEAALRPAPTLADLGELVESARSTGLTVELQVDVDEVLPSDVGLSAYRLVQEALTNVVKHSGAGTCRIDVNSLGSEVTVHVADDGPGTGRANAATRTPAAVPGGSSEGRVAPDGPSKSGTALGKPAELGAPPVRLVARGGAPDPIVLPGGSPGRVLPWGEPDSRGVLLGQGLIGMRERVAQFGGEFSAGPAPGGGWAVVATLRFAP
ncbi:sensor histidine kinase [Actinoplanes sp. LDG1-06]|uniref:histidine kinase n=1 Tax=Paractinoplanes ovalisporus TaxID=2810368 RepID=A0ABS2AD63_9ACTN|nr:histidine kinase [Actinoplanes ovalisporus]MBM2617767.1 sensor histidine kinase [Actinoplanes ovalisporus]